MATTKTNPNNHIVTIKCRHNLSRDHPDYAANRYETFGPYNEAQANHKADQLVEKGFTVLVHRLMMD